MDMEEVLLARVTPGRKDFVGAFQHADFEIEIFGDGFDGEVSFFECSDIRDGLDAAKRGGFIGFGDFRFFHFAIEILCDCLERAIEEFLFDVAEEHAVARAGENMGDAVSHCPRAQYGNSFDCTQRSSILRAHQSRLPVLYAHRFRLSDLCAHRFFVHFGFPLTLRFLSLRQFAVNDFAHDEPCALFAIGKNKNANAARTIREPREANSILAKTHGDVIRDIGFRAGPDFN